MIIIIIIIIKNHVSLNRSFHL